MKEILSKPIQSKHLKNKQSIIPEEPQDDYLLSDKRGREEYDNPFATNQDLPYKSLGGSVKL